MSSLERRPFHQSKHAQGRRLLRTAAPGPIASSCSPTTVASIQLSHLHAARCLSDAHCWTQRRPSAGHVVSGCLVPPGRASIKGVGTNGEGLIGCHQWPAFSLRNRRLHALDPCRFDAPSNAPPIKARPQGNALSIKPAIKAPKNVFVAKLLTPQAVEFATPESPLEQKENRWLLAGRRSVVTGAYQFYLIDLD